MSTRNVGCFANVQGPVFRSLVSAIRWLRGIKTYRFPWYLTLVSANHASSNPGQFANVLRLFANVFSPVQGPKTVDESPEQCIQILLFTHVSIRNLSINRKFKIYDATVAKTSSSSFLIYFAITLVCLTFES